jgi:hypothetical protein
MMQGVQQHFNICKKIGAQLKNEHWHESVPKLVAQVMKVM